MKRLEVITFRASYRKVNSVENEIRKLLNELISKKGMCEIKFYKSAMIDTDFSIHIYHETGKSNLLINDLKNEIISNLKNLGLVNHSIWLEKSSINKKS